MVLNQGTIKTSRIIPFVYQNDMPYRNPFMLEIPSDQVSIQLFIHSNQLQA